MKITEKEWKEKLTLEQYRVLREKGTEVPFTGKYVDMKDDGIYACAACGAELFASDTKFESGSGWPSFYDVAKSVNITLHDDISFGMKRTEVTCTQCGGHLGHLFEDGPQDKTGKRYCINSCSLDFKKAV